MKQLRTIGISLWIWMIQSYSHAQTYILLPKDSVISEGFLEDLQTLSIEQENKTAKDITIKWIKVSESLPNLWEASICDNKNCNTSLLDSGIMNPVSPGEKGLLLIHCVAKQNMGKASIRYIVYDTADINKIDTLTFLFQTKKSSSYHSINQSSDMIIQENKLILNENLGKIQQLEIYDCIGKILFYQNNFDKSDIFIPTINVSYYILKLQFENYTIVKRYFKSP